MAYLLLGLTQVIGVVVTILGWPGILVQIVGLAGFAWFGGMVTFGVVPLAVLCGIGIIGEIIYFIVGGPPDLLRRRRAGLFTFAGAVPGLLIGSFVFPLVGPLYGALLGALVGAALSGMGQREEQVGCATVARQAFAIGIRTAAGLVVAVFILLTLIR